MNESRRERILNLIGLGLVSVCFVLSLGRVLGRLAVPEGADGRTHIRFAHWQLESGLRDAFDGLAAEYMRRHPDVVVEPMAIPENVYVNWMRTQLIGGTAPEIMELGFGEGNELTANYFEPMTAYLERPNPYNRNNDLAATRWRDTFVDGLSHAYNQELLQYYTVPSSMFTIRMFYNRPLWRAVFGDEKLPGTYAELVERCRRARDYRTPEGKNILPVAGSQYNVPMLLHRLFASQTQRVFYGLARPDELYPTDEELAYDYLRGEWSFDTPAVRDGLELERATGQFFPPGFLQLKREDALFVFSQGRALMTVSGSWDAPSIRSQAPFEVGVLSVPMPTGDDPRYGRNTVGAPSEAGAATGLTFGMTKLASASKRARVVDFLQFLTSRDANREFSEESGWLPSVVGVKVRPEVEPFLPQLEGYPAGFNPGLSAKDYTNAFDRETGQVSSRTSYRLFEPDGGAEAYARVMKEEMGPAVRSDFGIKHRNQGEIIIRQDTTLAAYRALSRVGGKGENWPDKVSELDELQTQEEIGYAGRRWRMGQVGVKLEK